VGSFISSSSPSSGSPEVVGPFILDDVPQPNGSTTSQVISILTVPVSRNGTVSVFESNILI